MREFEFEIAARRVVFGPGSRHRLAEEMGTLGSQRVLIIADPSHRSTAEEIAQQLGARCAGTYDRVTAHVPVETAEAGREQARQLDADCYLAIGGGSAIGLAKAIALEIEHPIVAVPTTYAGSEMTPIWGLTEGGVKRTGRAARVLPRLVIYDPELTMSLPPHVAGPSGLNAMAHCVEALYAENANPVMSLLAEEGVRSLATALPRVVARPEDIDAQAEALYGAWLGGLTLASVGMALHHKLCHVLGGTFNTPHAETHALMLPYVTAFNLGSAPDAERRLRAALGTRAVAVALRDLGQAVGAPESLKALGLAESDLQRAAELATQSPYYNPREVTTESVHALLQDAYAGVMPRE